MKFFTRERRLVVGFGCVLALSAGLIARHIQPSLAQDWLINLSSSAIMIVLTVLIVEKLIASEQTRRNLPAKNIASKKLAGPLYGIKMEMAGAFGIEVTESSSDQELTWRQRSLLHDKALVKALLKLDYKSQPYQASKIPRYTEQLERTIQVVEEDLKYYSYALSVEEKAAIHKVYESLTLAHKLVTTFDKRKDREVLSAVMAVTSPDLLADVIALEDMLQLDRYAK